MLVWNLKLNYSTENRTYSDFLYFCIHISRPTVVNHLQIERLSFVDVVEVLHGDNQTQLQDRQTCQGRRNLRFNLSVKLRTGLRWTVLPWSMFALASARYKRLASRRSAGVMDGLATETRLKHNIWKEQVSFFWCSRTLNNSEKSFTCDETWGCYPLKDLKWQLWPLNFALNYPLFIPDEDFQYKIIQNWIYRNIFSTWPPWLSWKIMVRYDYRR